MSSVSKSSIMFTLSGLEMPVTAHVLPLASAACAVPHTSGAMVVASQLLSICRKYTQPQGDAATLMSCEPPMSEGLAVPETVVFSIPPVVAVPPVLLELQYDSDVYIWLRAALKVMPSHLENSVVQPSMPA
jgi:hypothetical protein